MVGEYKSFYGRATGVWDSVRKSLVILARTLLHLSSNPSKLCAGKWPSEAASKKVNSLLRTPPYTTSWSFNAHGKFTRNKKLSKKKGKKHTVWSCL